MPVASAAPTKLPASTTATKLLISWILLIYCPGDRDYLSPGGVFIINCVANKVLLTLRSPELQGATHEHHDSRRRQHGLGIRQTIHPCRTPGARDGAHAWKGAGRRRRLSRRDRLAAG